MLTVLAEGDGYVAVFKPPGHIVVPGRGAAATEVTVRQEAEGQLGRGLMVVHRLDRDTSGVLLLATDAVAHRVLSRAFERHDVVKHYWALVRGLLMGGGEVDLPLIPIRGGRVRAARPGESGGKASRTAWRALERIGGYTIVDFRPATGRLHQIRAHAAALGHPLAVDPDYGGAAILTVANVHGGPLSAAGRADEHRQPREPPHERDQGQTREARPNEPAGEQRSTQSPAQTILKRMPLHARSIKFPHPRSGQAVVVEAPLAEDLVSAIALLRRISAVH